MSLSKVAQLQSLIQGLKEEKKSHLRAIQEIDNAFAGLGLSAEVGVAGRPVVKTKGLKKVAPAQSAEKAVKVDKRKKFKVAGSAFILNAVKAGGAKGLPSSEIVEQWNKSGRGKSFYNVLADLVKKGKLKKHAAKKGEPSIYTLA